MRRTVIFLLTLASLLKAAGPPIELTVDASDVTRRLLHAKLKMPVSPGSARLAYPKWIPGEHAPTGPVTDVADLKITGGGKTLTWRRDSVDLFVIAVDIPAGVSSIEVSFDFISPPEAGGFSSGSSNDSQLAVISWNQLLMYPAGTPSDQIDFKASLKVPRGWKYGTALPIARESGDTIEFQPASLTTVVDSPVLTGINFRTIELAPSHYLHMAADSTGALQVSDDKIAKYRNLIQETGALYGSRHYRDYHFLLTLSDHVAHFGLEHHESSDDRVGERTLLDDDLWRANGDLLSHEMTHSWNGKFRRPAGLATPDYGAPMDGGLLWVYEGLTQYLGEVLAARSGVWTPEEWRENAAETAASMDATPGLKWRPLEDTATAAQLLYDDRSDWRNIRRGTDFYPEGSLIWLEADTIIRRESHGQKSLDTFIQNFYGGPGGKPELKTYTADDLYAALQAVQPYDWQGFFRQRVYEISERAPMGGITGGGWRLVYRDAPTSLEKSFETASKRVEVRYSLGLTLDDEGEIVDVLAGSPADRAGMAPAAKLLAISGRQFTKDGLRAAIRDAKNSSAPIELLVKDGDWYKTFRVDCHTGERYPDLERVTLQQDLLSEIVKPRANAHER